jgi:hypothetical protein
MMESTEAGGPFGLRLSEGLGATATTASTTQQKPLTLADLERVAQVLRDMPAEPIGEWMRAQDRPPEQWRVVFPKAMRETAEGPTLWPDYVAFSDVLDRPVFLPRGLWAWDLAPNVGATLETTAAPK